MTRYSSALIVVYSRYEYKRSNVTNVQLATDGK